MSTNTYAYYNADGTIKRFEILDKTREERIKECKEAGFYCGALIQQDGWQISPDYPW